MQKNNLNVIVFDDDQNVQNQPQMVKYTSQSMKSIKHQNKTDLIANQIVSLQDKIRKLEIQGEKIKKQFSKTDANNSNITTISPNFKQLDHLLMVVQKKIQIVVQQSKKILQKLCQNFDKKMDLKAKNDPNLKYKSKCGQIQRLYVKKIEQNQKQYKQELEKVISHNKKLQQKMFQKVSYIEQKFINKMNEFQTKEKQYVDWIHHLQAKLKQNKNKKMIQITQQKHNLSKVQSKTIIPIEVQSNVPSNLQNKTNLFTHALNPDLNLPTQNNNSRIHRKHKIFGNSNNRSSMSPLPQNNQKQKTPSKHSNTQSNTNKEFHNFNNNQIDNISKPQKDKNWNHSNNDQVNYNNLQTNKTNFGFSKQLRSANQSQFYRDVPKPGHGWDKFADIDINDDDLESEYSDDFFYPAHIRDGLNNNDQFSQNYSNNQKVLNQIPIQSRHNQQNRGKTYKPTLNSSNNWMPSSQNKNENKSEKVLSPLDLN